MKLKKIVKNIMTIIGMVLIITVGSSTFAVGEKFTGTVINVATGSHSEFHILAEQLVPEFERQTGMKVNFEYLDLPVLRTKELLDVRTQKGHFDILAMDIVWIGEYSEYNILSPLDDLIALDSKEVQWDDLTFAGREMVTWNGKVWALPVMLQYWIMYYRKDLLKNAGIQRPPITWDEFAQDVKKLYHPEKKQYGWVSCCARGNAIVHNWWAYFAGFGGKVYKNPPHDYTPIMDGPIAAETLEFWKKLLPYAPPGMTAYSWLDAMGGYGQGYVALYPFYSHMLPVFEDPEQSKIIGLIGCTVQPHYLGRPQSKKIPYGGLSFGISQASRKKEAAWVFLKWVASQEVGLDWIQRGGQPTRLSQLRNKELQKKFPWYSSVLEVELKQNVNADYRPRIAAWPTIEDIFGKELNLAITGAKTIEQALSDANEALKDYMKKENYPMGK